MKRLHVSLSVKDIAQSVRFYTQLFAAHPTVQRDDYAKWLLEDPRVNFSILEVADAPGLNHLGIQTESEAELRELQTRMQEQLSEIKQTSCCYAQGKKGWAHDPQGIAWEGFFTDRDGLDSFGETKSIPETAAVHKPMQTPCC